MMIAFLLQSAKLMQHFLIGIKVQINQKLPPKCFLELIGHMDFDESWKLIAFTCTSLFEGLQKNMLDTHHVRSLLQK